jgi:hypothetical protein
MGLAYRLLGKLSGVGKLDIEVALVWRISCILAPEYQHPLLTLFLFGANFLHLLASIAPTIGKLRRRRHRDVSNRYTGKLRFKKM